MEKQEEVMVQFLSNQRTLPKLICFIVLKIVSFLFQLQTGELNYLICSVEKILKNFLIHLLGKVRGKVPSICCTLWDCRSQNKSSTQDYCFEPKLLTFIFEKWLKQLCFAFIFAKRLILTAQQNFITFYKTFMSFTGLLLYLILEKTQVNVFVKLSKSCFLSYRF